jgi:hypothetical protein
MFLHPLSLYCSACLGILFCPLSVSVVATLVDTVINNNNNDNKTQNEVVFSG